VALTKAKINQRGNDFGIEYHSLLVGAMDFLNHLKNANIIGMAYGIAPSKDLNAQLPLLSLVGTNAEPLYLAFKEFNRWSEGTDGDVVDLTIILMDDGGYIISLCPNWDRYSHLISPYNAVATPILTIGIWAKKLDSRGPYVDEFYLLCKLPVTPFLFGAAVYKGAIDELSIKPHSLHHPDDIKSLLKFNALVVTESEANHHPRAKPLIDLIRARDAGKHVKQSRKKMERDAKPTIHTIKKERMRKMKMFFPVTLFRLTALDLVQKFRADNRLKGVSNWQIKQAYCNLLLSKSLTDGQLHYVGIPEEDLTNQIAHALAERYEEADNDFADLLSFTVDDIAKQITLDAATLLRVWGDSPSSMNPTTLQKRLRKHNLL